MRPCSMTRKQRGEAYDLSSARDRAAFLALIDQEDDEEERPGAPRAARGSKKAEQAKEKRGKERFFKLKADLPSGGQQQQQSGISAGDGDGGSQRAAQVAALRELLGGTLPDALISDVYDGCSGDVEAALDALLAMAGDSAGCDPGASTSGVASTSTCTAAPSSSAPTPSSTAPPPEVDQAAPTWSWNDLPQDVMYAVLSHLTPPELARLAPVSRELRACVRRLQRVSRRLRLPPGLAYRAAVAMVRAYVHAATVDVSRAVARADDWTSRALYGEGARQEGAAARQLRAAALGEQEARLFQLLLAVAEGSNGRTLGGGVGVAGSGIAARGLESMNDGVLAEGLRALNTLR